MNYRPDIDGLRAVAVLPVVLFHAGVSGFSGGYVGVDVFFVISGYLITSIITGEVKANRFSIANFYERRSKRILPALAFYLFLAAILAVAIYPPHMIKEFGQSLFANSFFASNIFFYIKTDYFNDFSETALLLHTWSLSVEEQYYLVIPILLSFLLKLSLRWCLFVIGGLCFASLLYSQHLMGSDAVFSFYMLPSRFWELGVGSMLALISVKGERKSDMLAFFGLLLIAIAIFFYDSQTTFPGVTAILPVLGSVFVIAFSHAEGRVYKLLSFRPLVKIGLLSYSWYLSHHIIFAALRVSEWGFDNSYVVFGGVIASFLLAWFSWRFVEGPFRKNRSKRLYIFIVSFIVLFAFACVGYFLHKKDGLRDYKFSRMDKGMADLVIDFPEVLARRKVVWNEVLKNAEEPFDNLKGKNKILIVGDSKSEDFYVSTSLNQYSYNQFRRQRVDDSCMSASYELGGSVCEEERLSLFEGDLYKEADAVVLAATWQYATNSGVLELVGKMLSDNKKVYVLSTGNFNDVSSLSYVIANKNMSEDEEKNFLYSNIRWDWRRQYIALRESIVESGYEVDFLEKLDAFCDLPSEACSLRDNVDWYIYDSGHVTRHGGEVFGKRMMELGWFQ